MERKPMSKKMRFEIFKRDQFRCAYCGQTPPSVVLEVDHIEPLSKGGLDVPENMITACLDCNRGKAANPLGRASLAPRISIEEIQEREQQLKEYNQMLRRAQKRLQKDADRIQEIFSTHFNNQYYLKESFVENKVKYFLRKLPVETVVECMKIALANFGETPYEENAIRYFCGCCWKRIKANEN